MHDKDTEELRQKLRDLKYTIALIEQIIERKRNEDVVLPKIVNVKRYEKSKIQNALVVHSD